MAAVVERYQPGRFKFAVPHYRSDYGRAMMESLRAYGIEPHRVIPISCARSTQFRNAWAVTPIWSDRSPHPSALDVMRGAVRLIQHMPGRERIALMRRDRPTRTIVNGSEVEAALTAAGFVLTDATGLPFVEQVRMFQSATTIFGVLGSGLTGLIYSPNGVNVVAVAPSGWGDDFFYGIARQRNAKWAEVRGQSHWNKTDGLLRDAPFEVPLRSLHEALETLQ